MIILPLGTSLVVAELRTMRTVIDSWEKFLSTEGFPAVDNKELDLENLKLTLMNFQAEMMLMSDKAHSLASRLSIDPDDLE